MLPEPRPSPFMVRLRRPESGIALVLVLIFTILLYVLVTELVLTSRMARLTGENDALVARMHNHMAYVLDQVEEQLRDDVASGAGAGAAGGASALGGLAGAVGGAGAAGAATEGEGGAGETEDESANCDSSRDAWYEPAGYSDEDLTTYVWVEDENRKFNILSLVSEDQDFARVSKDRFVRLIDYLREDTEFDLSSSDGEEIARELIEWMRGDARTEETPRPPLKTDDPNRPEITIPLSLDELLMLRSVDEDLYYDKVLDGIPILGLESVLTISTSLATDPGDPNKQRAQTPDPNAPAGQASAAATAAANPLTSNPNGETGPPKEAVGEGIRININTATRPVLRCLFPENEMPLAVIDAILRYRNEEVEEEQNDNQDYSALGSGDYYGDMDLGQTKKYKIFSSIEDLDKNIPEFQNLANPEVKQRFLDMVTVNSDVFSVHMASLYKRNEKKKIFVLRRSRSVLVRLEGGEEPTIHPLVLLETEHGLRIKPVDFPEEFDPLSYQVTLDEMDQYARDERKWNPFYVEFYYPPDRY